MLISVMLIKRRTYFLSSQWLQYLTPPLVFMYSNILISLVPWYPFPFWIDEYHKTVILDNVTTYSDFEPLLSHYTVSYYIHVFLVTLQLSQLNVFSALAMINIFKQMKNFLVELMSRLFYKMIHQSVWYCWVTTAKAVVNPVFW